MRSTNIGYGLLLCLGGLLGAQQAAAHTTGQVHIDSFNAGGNGCPLGTARGTLTQNGTLLEIVFDEFIAELAPPNLSTFYPSNAACTVTLKLHLPPGIALSWYETEHRGFADMDGGSRGQFWARYYLPGQGGFDTVRIYNFNPGMVGAYTIENDNLGGTWTSCGGEQLMSVNTRVRLSGRPSNNDFLTVDSETQKVTTILRFRYQSCI